MSSSSRRDSRLDGLRGLATLVVLVSHFLAEVPSGIRALALGHVAVGVFFVLSGFLIGRLVLERRDCANVFRVFYARRILRTVPSYVVVLLAVLAAGALVLPGFRGDETLPLLSYLTFTQNLAMAHAGHVGSETLAPTWTLAVEEQFYLLAPCLLVFLPRAVLMPAVIATVALSLGYRLEALAAGEARISYLPTLLGNADQLAIGIGAALIATRAGRRAVGDRVLEAAPLACVLLILALALVLPREMLLAGPLRTLLALGAAAFILRLVLEPAAAPWLSHPLLCRAGHHSYSLYLVHMPVAVALHAALLGAHPDIGSPAALLVTILGAGVTVLLAAALTRAVEDPFTALGRRLRWAESHRPATRPAAA